MEKWGWEAWGWLLISVFLFADNDEPFFDQLILFHKHG
jgi:hypothetical protein